jgi:hypothetical protein
MKTSQNNIFDPLHIPTKNVNLILGSNFKHTKFAVQNDVDSALHASTLDIHYLPDFGLMLNKTPAQAFTLA